WRFVLMPGALTGQLAHAQTAWAGVLMPSVDKVGRYFPLTIAQPLSSLALNAAQTRALLAWLQQVDDAALDALQDDWSIDQLDAELQRVGIWRPDMPVVEDSAQQEAGPLDILTHMARDGLLSQLQGHALWLYPEPLGSLRLQISWGLPQGQAFSDLMTGTALPASLPVSHQIV
ncbi:type VI secretion system-associated protein TagF, partial [Roseateles sp. GG27B]